MDAATPKGFIRLRPAGRGKADSITVAITDIARYWPYLDGTTGVRFLSDLSGPAMAVFESVETIDRLIREAQADG